MISSPCKRICSSVLHIRKNLSCSSVMFNEPARDSEDNNCQSTSYSQQGEEKNEDRNELNYGDLENILNTSPQELIEICEKPVNIEKATAIKIMALMEIPPGMFFPGVHFPAKDLHDYWMKLKNTENYNDQAYDEKRVLLHGADSAAAHFFIDRQAAVRLKDCKDWIGGNVPFVRRYENGYFVNADRDERNYIVEAIDCNGFYNNDLQFEGLQYLSGLKHLKQLSLQNQTNIDALCLDRIARQNGDTIEFLNLTGIELDAACISALNRMKALKQLVVTEPEDAADRDLLKSFMIQNGEKLKVRIVKEHSLGKTSSRAQRPLVFKKTSSWSLMRSKY
ncbi:hypothetical protein O0L34_g17360 [Tuta absoluta]|nr:hypothetical protein O0L34_g17360 [Tuta absoluta]